MLIQNTRSSCNAGTSADSHQHLDLGIHLCNVIRDSLKIRVPRARATRNNKQINIQVVVKCIGWGDRWKEARVELVHGQRGCANRFKRLSDEVKIELLDGEREDLERI